MTRMHQNWFEGLIFGITISPFVFLLFSWHESIAQSAMAIYTYLFTTTIFYFFSVWFAQLDRRKENYDEMAAVTRQIRLIWAIFVAGVGLVLFVHSIYEHDFNFMRLTGVLMSLFLFAGGNFQSRLHPSSAFSSNRWLEDDPKFRKLQRNHARLKFWVGIIATVIFLTLGDDQLVIGYFFIAAAIIYGLVFRMINNFLPKN